MNARRTIVGIVLLLLVAGPALAREGRLAEGPAESPLTQGPTRAALKSLLWPGLGQLDQGRTGRGALWAGGAALIVSGAFLAHMEYNSAATDFNNAESAYNQALVDWDLEAAELQLAEMERALPRADDRETTRTIMTTALVVWWAGAAIDAYLGHDDAMARNGGAGGRVEPVLRQGRPGLAWSFDF